MAMAGMVVSAVLVPAGDHQVFHSLAADAFRLNNDRLDHGIGSRLALSGDLNIIGTKGLRPDGELGTADIAGCNMNSCLCIVQKGKPFIRLYFDGDVLGCSR